MKNTVRQILFALVFLAAASAISAPDVAERARSGGALTVVDASDRAYSHSAADLTDEQAALFALGYQMFHNRWAFFWFENAIFGRGPTSNAQACTTCHGRQMHFREGLEEKFVRGVKMEFDGGNYSVFVFSNPQEKELKAVFP